VRPENLQQLTARACDAARLQPDNPEFKGLPAPQSPQAVEAFDVNVADCSPEERAARVAVICRKAAESNALAAGSMTTSALSKGVANSKGIFVEHRSTMVDLSTVIMSPDSSGWAQSTAWRLDAISPETLADEALWKVRQGHNAADFGAGDYPVILDPYATADLLEMLAFDGMGALAVQEGRSWMNSRLGQRVMAESVSIIDDGLSKDGLPWPFDFEGVPKKVVPLVASGVALTPVYDSFTAGREEGKQSTGHATPPSPQGRFGPAPMNLFLRPGTATLDAMIRSTKLGLYITRFWYTRTVHPRDAVVTGMTRDGTFVIRDGEIAHPVKSMRFTQSYLDALRDTEAIGAATRLLRSGFGGATSVPAVKLGQFRFTSSTR
jgi:predicted Zn-dependent protease